MAQEPCLDMAILHVLVLAVFVCVGQSTACVEWMIANPPIIFGKTAELLCSPVTPNISSRTHNITSWIGGKNYAFLTFNGGTVDPSKYADIQGWHRGKFESILQIYKFDEMDVNVNYKCSIGKCQNTKMLSLTPDKFEYHPDKDTTIVLTNFRNGYLDVIVEIIKVYPIPKCTIMLNENIISRRLTTKTSVNGIFYMVVVEVDQLYVDVCSSQLNVTCVVGKTEISIYQETFNRCTKTKEESPEDVIYVMISIIIGVLLCIILIVYRAKNRRLVWREEERISMKSVIMELITQDNEGPTHNAKQEEKDEIIHSIVEPYNYDRHTK